MRPPDPTPVEVRRAAWRRLWRRLLIDPPADAEPETNPPEHDSGPEACTDCHEDAAA